MLKIYHNPNCTKSRAALDLLKAKGEDFELVEYLGAPLTSEELKGVLKLLQLPARSIIRTGEGIFKELYADIDLDDESAIISAILKHPILLERPIVIKDDKAAIGRPTENLARLWL